MSLCERVYTATLLLLAAPLAAQADVKRTERVVEFNTSEATAMNVDVSPDGREIAFDILGDIYTVPIAGGRAQVLLSGRSWDTAPRYSQDGKSLVFISDRNGGIEGLWQVDRQGKRARQLASGQSQRLLTPIWSQDGSTIVLSRNYCPWVYDIRRQIFEPFLPSKCGQKEWRENWQAPVAALSPDAKCVYLTLDAEGKSVYYGMGGPEVLTCVDRATAIATPLTPVSDADKEREVFQPLVSHGGQWLTYFKFTPADQRTTLMLRSLQTNEERSLMSLDEGLRPSGKDIVLPAYAFTPDDRSVVISSGGKIWRVPLDGRQPQAIEFKAHVKQTIAPLARPRPQDLTGEQVQIKAIRGPVLSADGRYLVFTAVNKLWVQDMKSGARHRLTQSNDSEYSAAISPDGKWVAYLAFPRDSQLMSGEDRARRLALVPLTNQSPAEPRLLTEDYGAYTCPVWFGDSRRVLSTENNQRAFVWTTIDHPSLQKAGSLPNVGGSDSGFSDDFKWNGHESTPAIGPDERVYWLVADEETFDPNVSTRDSWATVYSVKLDGSDVHKHLRIHGGDGDDSGGYTAAISPDARQMMLTPIQNPIGVFVADIPPASENPPSVSVQKPSAGIRKVSDGLAIHISWQKPNHAVFSVGPKITVAETNRNKLRTLAVDMQMPRYRPTGTVAIRGARLITVAGKPGLEKVIESGTVVMTNGKLVAVGEADSVQIPNGATIIDGTGLTVLPGFIDVHKHAMKMLHPPSLPHPDDIVELAYGVTGRYDPMTDPGDQNLERREVLETSANSFGLRYYYSGRGRGGRQSIDLPLARRIAAKYDALGATVFKEYIYRTRFTRQSLAQAMRERGLGITAESEDFNRMMSIVADGFTSFEHTNFLVPIFGDVTHLMAAGGFNWTPTVVVANRDNQGWEYFYRVLARENPGEFLKLSRFIDSPASYQSFLGEAKLTHNLPFALTRLGRESKAVVRAINDGVTVSIGAHNPPGIHTHFEMWSLVEAGATPMQAIRAGTLNGAAKIGIDHAVGTLEQGKLADLIVLTANPLESIRNTLKLKYVIANGVLYDAETMDRLWPDYGAVPRMPWQTLEEYASAPRGRKARADLAP